MPQSSEWLSVLRIYYVKVHFSFSFTMYFDFFFILDSERNTFWNMKWLYNETDFMTKVLHPRIIGDLYGKLLYLC